MKKFLAILMVVALVVCFAACGNDPKPQPANNNDPNKDIVIVYTSDVHCGIEDGFGYVGLAAVRDNLQKNNNVILVDNGDAIQGAPVGTMTKGEAIVNLMNEVGYEVAIPGNHEFDYGMTAFLELAAKAKYSYISCNFNKDGATVFSPYVIKELGGKKVAFVGVTTPETMTSSDPKSFQDENGNYIYGFMQGEEGKKLYNAVQTAVDAARAEGADYVVLMSHLGNEEACAPYTYANVVENTTGIDALLDGHSHDSDQVVMKNKDGKEVVRTASGTKLESVGYLRIAVDGTITSGLYTWKNDVSPVELFGLDGKVKTALDAATASLDAKLNEVVARTTVTLTINDPTATTAEGKAIRIIRNAETNLGDLCADAYRAQSGADVAMVNGGGIRVSIEAGDITLGNILNVHPFGNALCVVEASGQQILDALELGVKSTPGESGGFQHVSGMTYEIHTYIPSSVVQDENGMFVGVNGEYRVKNVMVGGEPLDLNKTYTLASHNYMLKSGGDGFSMFQGCNLLVDEAKLDNQVLIDYITETLGGVVGEEYAEPYGQGRIVAVEAAE